MKVLFTLVEEPVSGSSTESFELFDYELFSSIKASSRPFSIKTDAPISITVAGGETASSRRSILIAFSGQSLVQSPHPIHASFVMTARDSSI